MSAKLTVGSLFSGIGGLDLGLEWSGGFETKWFVECDPHAQTILRKNFPNSQVYDDVTTLDFRTVQKVDVLTGGFPCQDISNAGKGVGITGSRSSLWKHYLRAIDELEPRKVIIENVEALRRKGLETVLYDLASIGYDAEWHCISASAIGAPHRRDRIFIISYPNSQRCFYRQTKEQSNQRGKSSQLDFGKISIDVSNSCCEGLQGQCESERVQETHSINGVNGWWSVEPELGRVAHGVSNRIHRIKRLGNAVVPQLAQTIAEAIIKEE